LGSGAKRTVCSYYYQIMSGQLLTVLSCIFRSLLHSDFVFSFAGNENRGTHGTSSTKRCFLGFFLRSNKICLLLLSNLSCSWVADLDFKISCYIEGWTSRVKATSKTHIEKVLFSHLSLFSIPKWRLRPRSAPILLRAFIDERNWIEHHQ